MRKFIKWLGIFIGIVFLSVLVGIWVAHEPRPEGESGMKADALAAKMLEAVDKKAWDTTAIVQWSFAGIHHYLWDKERNYCRIRWGNDEVLLNLNNLTGRAWKEEEELTGAAASKKVESAWEFFANDSFWFNAVVKAFDPGTHRSLVPLEDGGEGVMVHYSSGGVTPGDSYLWILDENGLPKKWKMWVSVLPVGGVESTWEDWITLSTGARIATSHKTAGYTLRITDVRGAASLEAFGLTEDPFALLNEKTGKE